MEYTQAYVRRNFPIYACVDTYAHKQQNAVGV